MKKQYYEEIFRRKSFHLFLNVGKEKISSEELNGIADAYENFERLIPDIRTAIRIVPAAKVNFKRDAEYCILIYSEKKDNYLLNAGYLGEQLDLYLVSKGIGTLWYGIGKPDEAEYDGLSYVIMIAVRKVSDPSKFRKDMYKSRRRELTEIWSGDDPGIGDVSRFAPSACNSQPWYVKNENGLLTVFRYRKPGKTGIMPAASVSYYNRIDTGIYLCILEICMEQKGLRFERALFIDDGGEREYTKIAEYRI